MSKAACKAIICRGQAEGLTQELIGFIEYNFSIDTKKEEDYNLITERSELVIKKLTKLFYDLDELE